MDSIQQWLSTQSTKVKTGLMRVDSNIEPKYKVMFRTDKRVPETFYPIMPTSAQEGEDNTCPRVCVSPTILQCLLGYGRLITDITDFKYNLLQEYPEENKRTGGYQISMFNYDTCFKVDTTLVAESKTTDEHWLVSYSQDTTEYKPNNIGHCFVTDVTLTNRGQDAPIVKARLYVNIKVDNTFWFSRDQQITKGQWFVDLKFDRLDERMQNVDVFKITQIDTARYAEIKNRHVFNLEHIKPNATAISRW